VNSMLMAKGASEMEWKILALDLDGTVMAEGERISSRVLESLRMAERCGVHVVLATGRGDGPALRYAAKLGLTTPVICYHGAMICDPWTGHAIHEELMPTELAAQVVAWGQVHDRHLLLFADSQLWMREMRYPQEVYDRWMGLPLREMPILEQALRAGEIRRVHKLIDLIPESESETPSLASTWRAAFGHLLQVMRSHPRFIELTPLHASKGRALAWLAQMWGISQAQVIAVGDAENDLSMIEWAGLGVAMGQAAAHVRAAADWVAPSVEEDGVAEVIRRFILNGRA
jgi:Cof subfamily protein (haloacid dehalogenase superfamily)